MIKIIFCLFIFDPSSLALLAPQDDGLTIFACPSFYFPFVDF